MNNFQDWIIFLALWLTLTGLGAWLHFVAAGGLQ